MQRMRASLACVFVLCGCVCVCVSATCAHECRGHLTSKTMNGSERKSLFLFFNSRHNVFISSDSLVEIEMPYGSTTGEESK